MSYLNQTAEQSNIPYTLSIETDAGSYQHGFHLGTEWSLAKQIAQEAFEKWVPKIGTHIKTVALKREGKMWVYSGRWE